MPGRGAGGAGRGAPGCAVLSPAGLGLRGSWAPLASVRPRCMRPRASLSLFCMKFQWKKMNFMSLLLVFSAVAVSRAQVQQEPSAETSEGTGINITCSHPNIQPDYIHWYRQLPGRAPTFLVSAVKGSKEVPEPEGRLSVSADRRSSALLIAQPRHGDAAVYYCAVGTRGEEPRLRPGTNRFGRGGGTVPSGPAGGAADYSLPAPPEPALLTWNMSLALLGTSGVRRSSCTPS